MSFRKITVKSGNEESTLEVTEEEYRNYFRPWWQQKKHEQRNRQAMEQNGYTEESYEAWRDDASEGAGIPDMELPGVDELVEKGGNGAYGKVTGAYWYPAGDQHRGEEPRRQADADREGSGSL